MKNHHVLYFIALVCFCMAVVIDPRQSNSQDTFDLCNEIQTDDMPQHTQNDIGNLSSDEDHSVVKDDSSNKDRVGKHGQR